MSSPIEIIPAITKAIYPGLSYIATASTTNAAVTDDSGKLLFGDPISLGLTYLPGSSPSAQNALLIDVPGFAYYLIPLTAIVSDPSTSSYVLKGTPIKLSNAEAKVRTGISSSTSSVVFSGDGAYQTVRFSDGTNFGELNIYKDHISLVL
jgi:hypothetical protein